MRETCDWISSDAEDLGAGVAANSALSACSNVEKKDARGNDAFYSGEHLIPGNDEC